MAPTVVEKLVSERDAVADKLEYIDIKIKDNVENPLNAMDITDLIQQIAESFIKLDDIHIRIRTSVPADMTNHKRDYHLLMDTARSLQNALQGLRANLPVTPNTEVPHRPKPQQQEIRLPKLELKSFDGNLLEWISFRDLYKSSVHENNSLSKIQKMTYLQTLLKGEASKQIQSMLLSDANYDTAWQQLHDRYQNDREILFAVMRRLLNQQTVQPSSSAIRSLVDTTRECLRSLEILNLKADKAAEAIILFVVTTKIDHSSRELWEQQLKGTTIPPLTDLFDFLEQRARALSAGGSVTFHKHRPKHEEHPRRVHAHHGQHGHHAKCKVCNKSYHPLFKCKKFLSHSILEKYELLKKHNMCTNCLIEGHSTNSCQNPYRCKHCKAKHHTFLHKPHETIPSSTVPSTQELTLSHHVKKTQNTLKGMLATASIQVVGIDGNQYLCRALLDGGSTDSFITQSCLRRLGLRRKKHSAEVVGLATCPVGTTLGESTLIFSPHFKTSSSYTVTALVLPKVTDDLPVYPCDPSQWSHVQGLTLADPTFHKPQSIDILLGSDVFWSLLEGKTLAGPPGSPLAVSSTLGWLIAGSSDTAKHNQVRVHFANKTLDQQLEKFWEIESLPSERVMTKEEVHCETHFDTYHTRDNTGRFTVAIPWKEPKPALGSSRDIAFRRLKQLEKRLVANSEFQQQYIQFMREYLELGHMTLVPEQEVLCPLHPTNFIPHHFVQKEDSTTTKFRVVFDASCKTTTGNSLNDAMMVGPALQDNLVDIIMRFRLHPVAFTADIAKMYRQILVSPADADMQRILWRESPDDEVKEYRLNTVTYGTASAPYLAVKCLQQLAKDEKETLPLASATATDDGYVDDIMSGSTTVNKALELQKQLLDLANRGGFELRKWSSNKQELLDSLPDELRASHHHLDITVDQSVKTLGIRWNTSEDQFEFRYDEDDVSTQLYTKRRVLSEMSKLFDPLGWLSPIIIKAKMLMQSLWKLEAQWDEPLPLEIQNYWTQFKVDLKKINQIYIPRCIIPQKPKQIHLAGFSDASEKAYAAVVYLVVKYNDHCLVSLVSSKTRVAPAKQISLPRLELCGSLLLAQLMDSVQRALKLDISILNAYTDSTVVIAWITSHPSRWKTFVANRVTKIQTYLPCCQWNHIPGVENPADLPSRGCSPDDLRQSFLWWRGPVWLQSPMSHYPSSHNYALDTEDMKNLVTAEERQVVMVLTARSEIDLSLLKKYSSLNRLIRITAWILRFTANTHPGVVKLTGPLSTTELNNSLNKWIQITQGEEFSYEMHLLSNNKLLPAKNRLLPLHPFVDSCGILRVGGRLRNAPVSPDQKYPILLPRHSRLTELIIISKHKQHLHAGPTLLLAILQQKFWIIRARDAVRFLVRKCLVCRRNAATTQQQIMADLPLSRVTPCRAFQKCGVDYCGPFLLKPDLKRSKTTVKAWLALFVCFTTRSFHLELVSSLSTDAFLAALRRFVSRRGRPTDIHSDCGTNFIGANRELDEMLKLVRTSPHNHKVAKSLSEEGISWHFNPPGAPHFGGLWEAGVKSVKFHLHRIVGSTRLTFEEMTTTVTQIEAILNSRPLTPFSTDPSDLNALTSGHFLIGQPLLAIPEPDLTTLNQNKLSRWQLIQSFQQQFWKRWSQEFLTRLQQRPKWLQQRKNLQIGDLVLIKDDNLPPLQWKLARVIILHPGKDDIVRVVTLHSSNGEIKRPIHKLCLLPIDNEDSSEI